MALFLGPRYEFALLAGLVTPFVLSLWFALAKPQKLNLWNLVRPVGFSTALLFALAFLGGFYEGNCEPLYGYALLFGGPVLGLLSLAFAVTFALERSPPRVQSWWLGRIGVALAVPALVLGYGLYRLYADPAVFAYSEFTGYFAGPLYDLVDYRLGTLLTYRLGSLLLISGLAIRLFAPSRKIWARLCLSLYVVYRACGPSLSHELSETSLSAKLPARLEQSPCIVRYNPELTARSSAELVLRQCTVDVRGLVRYFGSRPPTQITVSLFANVNEKGQITGAGRTYVAKPWRREVHLHEAGFPHPTLRHELAHVVSADFGQGPFRLAGALGGWIPDPGRVEGFAVAAAPALESDGTLEQWAAAQATIGKLPALARLFQFGFYGSAAVSAYGSSGAFVSFLHDTYGPHALRAWYGGESLTKATGLGLAELEQRFLAHLKAVAVPAFVERAAQQRFSALPVGERRCPHAVDRALGEAAGLCALDPTRAEQKVDFAVRLDPSEADSRLWLSECFLSARALEHGRALLTEYAPGPPWSARDKALRLADLAFQEGNFADAEAVYRRLAESPQTSAESRALGLRLWALSSGTSAADRTIVQTGALTAMRDAQRLAGLTLGPGEITEGFVRPYLLGRLWASLNEHAAALKAFQMAARHAAPDPSFRIEALRGWLIQSCALGESVLAEQAHGALLRESLSMNQRREAAYLRELCF